MREFFFDDDTFTYNLPRGEEIARALGRIGVTWSCNANTNVPRQTLKVMCDNGLRLLLVGYEPGNQQLLHEIKKGMRVEAAKAFTRHCHELGITIHGTFILGLPAETKETIEETIGFATEINPHTLQVSLAAPYPGTFLYEQALANNWLDEAHAELVDERGVQNGAAALPASLPSGNLQLGRGLLPALLFAGAEDRRHSLGNDPEPASDGSTAALSGRVLPVPSRAQSERPLNRLIITADDFGPAEEVNSAVEEAHRSGILSAASLMVGGAAATDAVRRARDADAAGRLASRPCRGDADAAAGFSFPASSTAQAACAATWRGWAWKSPAVRRFAGSCEPKSPRNSRLSAALACLSTMSTRTSISTYSPLSPRSSSRSDRGSA